MPEGHAKAPRILVIEDNAVTGQLIRSQLTSSGYETLKCERPETRPGK